MPRPKKPTLSYLRHKPTNQAYVRMSDGKGGRTVIYLGVFDSPESRAEHARILAGMAAAPSPEAAAMSARGSPADVTVNEILLAFLRYADRHYRRTDGSPTDEVGQYKQTFRVVRALLGHTRAVEFGPLALKAVRQGMVDAGWCRNLVNQRVGRVRRVFKWAASEELLPAAVFQALATVQGLQAGRTPARESEAIGPVDDATVDATLAHLNRHVLGLVEFQRLTGCRPGEACAVRRCDIEMSGAVWLYRPGQHKTAWRGKRRVVYVAERAQALLREYFTPDIDAYLFSPRRAVAELHADRAAKRRTPRYPSHARRNAEKRAAAPARRAAEKYKVTAYEHAIARACDKAFPAPKPLGRREGESRRVWRDRLSGDQRKELAAWQSSHRWHPNQLRHLFATDVRKAHGLEAAQVLLGHSRADVTQVYAARNEALAASVAEKIG
jgi:integrase